MKIIIAGGGTGGHLFPGIAIAEAFRKRDSQTQVLFIGTDRGIEKRVIPESGYDLKTLDVEGIKGRGFRSLTAALKIPRSLVQAIGIIRDFSPDLVIGVGGYASGPAVASAWLLRVRTAIAEQNAIPGLTNRMLGRLADRIFLTFPDEGGYFAPSRVVLTGNPIRSSFVTYRAKQQDGSFSVLVFGGSQGARSINRAMVEAFPALKGLSGLKIVHQTGPSEYERIAEAYRAANVDNGIDVTVRPFISDMASAFAEADLLICRAGATSIAEITVCGKAAVLIPFPYAAHDHQTKNARILADADAAVMIPETALSGTLLAQTLQALYEDRSRVQVMAARAAAMGNSDAADRILDECLALVRKVNSE